MKENAIKDKSFAFAKRIVKLYKHLCDEKKEFIMSKQLMRSGTSIGANVYEAERGSSRKDFANKLSIALKEANESEYWIELLFQTNFLSKIEYDSLIKDCVELNKLLITIVKNTNNKEEA